MYIELVEFYKHMHDIHPDQGKDKNPEVISFEFKTETYVEQFS